jgi:competence protein ComFC
VLSVLFPIACPGCGRPARDGAPVCAGCLSGLVPAPRVAPPPGLDAWYAPFAYEGAAREMVARIKYRNVRAVVPWLAVRMAESVSPVELDAAVITWAPTTPAHRRARGFDPAELLARALARRLRRPARLLLARAPGPPQTGLPAATRWAGPRFASRRAAPRLVLVVDDIATTGATLTAAASALRAGGATRVVAVTAARTPRPGGS